MKSGEPFRIFFLLSSCQSCANLFRTFWRHTLRYLDRLQPLALVVVRLTLGAIMTVHGYHKVFGGLHQFAHMVGSMGLPSWLGYISAFTELLGGLLILVGFFPRPAAIV